MTLKISWVVIFWVLVSSGDTNVFAGEKSARWSIENEVEQVGEYAADAVTAFKDFKWIRLYTSSNSIVYDEMSKCAEEYISTADKYIIVQYFGLPTSYFVQLVMQRNNEYIAMYMFLSEEKLKKNEINPLFSVISYDQFDVYYRHIEKNNFKKIFNQIGEIGGHLFTYSTSNTTTFEHSTIAVSFGDREKFSTKIINNFELEVAGDEPYDEIIYFLYEIDDFVSNYKVFDNSGPAFKVDENGNLVIVEEKK